MSGGGPARPTTEADLRFKRQSMVDWLRPTFLLRAGLEVALSGLFASFADKREVEAGLAAKRTYVGDRDADGALWFDYAADVGEGFDSTYTVARLLGAPSLALETEAGVEETRRGRLLVLGGDQVYPSAGWDAYRDRFVGPYRAALPYVAEPAEPHLYAIPGNHDWYDGLTSFMRLFCQSTWIGGWQTQQQRSYFALRLSERWWLWATDIQFDTYIDGPQLAYFRSASDELRRGDRVIIATAKPSWADAEPDPAPVLMKAGSWEALSYIEEALVAGAGAEVALTLSGDKHHYSRYERESPGNPRHRITAGGGGAHTTTTHGLRPRVELTGARSEATVGYALREALPTREQSYELRDQVFMSVARVHTLGILIGAIYALLAVLVADGLKDQASGLRESLVGRGVWELVGDSLMFWNALLIVALFAGLIAFANTVPGEHLSQAAKRLLFGALHAAAHVVPAFALTLLALWLLRDWAAPAEDGLALGWIVAAALFAVGFTYGRLVFALYLWLANRNDGRQHATEINGANASTEYKNFLRLRLGPDETLTVYPIGIRSCPSWRLAGPGGADTDPWFVPDVGQREPEPKLIETPISIPAD
jgi:hypothetical protein